MSFIKYFNSPHYHSNFSLVFGLVVFLLGCGKPQQENNEEQQELNTRDKTLSSVTTIVSEDPERDLWQKPLEVIAKMGDLKGKTVVDIGAGTGYFTFQLALKADKVIATDIDASFLEYIQQRKQEYYPELESNIVTRLTQSTDPLISPNEADWILLINTYDYLPDKIQYLSKIKAGLKKEGCFMLIDFKKQPKGKLKTEYPVVSISEVASNLSASGFSKIKVDDTTLPYQYIIMAYR